MSYTTDLIGHIEVDPPLNCQEQNFLHFFSESRRYGTARHGARDHKDHYPPALAPVPARPVPGAGRPGRWCQWVSDCDGQCLTHNGSERFYAPTAWLQYIIDHFLAPAAVQTAGGGQFDAFTFDHVCNGVVAGCRRGTGRRFLIRVTNNAVTQEALFDGHLADREIWPPFGYESELDRRRALRPRRVGRGPAYSSSVIPFRPVAEADRE
jgi:hypothetical protein